MRKRHLVNLIFPAMALMSVSSCQDYDANFSEEALLKQQYAEQFEKMFGKVDPNQDWSMATQITAKVNLDKDVNGTLTVYTNAPTTRDCIILGTQNVENGNADFTFDIKKGTQYVYARIENKGRIIYSSYAPVVNGSVVLQKNTSLATRATCTVTKGEEVDYPITMIKKSYRDDLMASNTYDTYVGLIGGTNNVWQLTENGSIPHMYRLNGVDFSQKSSEYTLEYLFPIFGDYLNVNGIKQEGVFKEAIDHAALMTNNSAIKKDVVYTVTETGPISLDCIWRGTDETTDFFGYYYYDPNDYPGGAPTPEDLLTINKYILIDDKDHNSEYFIGGTPANHLTEVNFATENNGEVTYAGYVAMAGGTAATWLSNANPATGGMASTKTLMRGTTLNLVNFGKDGTSTPSFDFDEGTKIGFFLGTSIISTGGPFYFSTCADTYYLFRYPYYKDEQYKSVNYSDYLSSEFLSKHTLYEDSYYEGPDARPYAMTFDYDGLTILGFGDGRRGDKDLNDICFVVNGNIEKQTDLTPDDVPLPQTQKWVVACEDLGNTFDYDFNDIVLGFERKNDKLYMKALAACGTLPAHILWNGVDKGEIHHLCNSSVPEDAENYSIITKASNGAEIELCAMTGSDETSITTMMSNLTIAVATSGDATTYITGWDSEAPNNENGSTTPQMLLLPGGWDWPTEGTLITSVYPDFQEWTIDCAKTDWTDNRTGTSFVTNSWGGSGSANISGGSSSGTGSNNGNNGQNQGSAPTIGETITVVSNQTTNSDIALPAALFVSDATKIEITLENSENANGWSYFLREQGSSNTLGNFGNSWNLNNSDTWTITDTEILTKLKSGKCLIGGIWCNDSYSITVTIKNLSE